jgi:ABC-type multidrug transport system fused ATPase/permease subunit
MSLSRQEQKLVEAIANNSKHTTEIPVIINDYSDFICGNLTSVKRAFDGYGKYLNNTVDEFYKLKDYDSQDTQYDATQEKLYNRVKQDLNDVINDKNTASRKHEMNEWTFGNKNDTLFVYSACFIMISVFLLFTGLMRMGVISSSVWLITVCIGIIAFVLIVLNRYSYTNAQRNNRYWNKKRYGEGSYATRPSSSCLSDEIESELSNLKTSFKSSFRGAVKGVTGGLSYASQQASALANTASTSINEAADSLTQ